VLLGIDPSTAIQDKDPCAIKEVRVGYELNGGMVVEFQDDEYVVVDVMNEDVPLEVQLANNLVAEIITRKVPIGNVCIDSGGGYATVSGFVEEKLGKQGIIRVNPGGAASSRKLYGGEPLPKEQYQNRATELIANFGRLIMSGQCRGASDKQVHQITTRQYDNNKSPGLKAESKGRNRGSKSGEQGWRDRNDGESPNEMDAGNVALDEILSRGLIDLTKEVKKSDLSWNVENKPPISGVDLRIRVNRVRSTIKTGW